MPLGFINKVHFEDLHSYARWLYHDVTQTWCPDGPEHEIAINKMIHFTCDRCKQAIDPQNDMRYVLRIEIEAAVDPHCEEIESSSDHLSEISNLLESSDDYAAAFMDEEIYHETPL